MILAIFAKHKLLVELYPFFDIDENGNLEPKPVPDKFAIPGGKTASEKTVRRWAKSLGYTVHQRYQGLDLH